MTVRLIVEFTALPGREDDVADLVCEYREKVLAESGATSFEVYRKANHPEHFFLLECFADKSAHLEHLSSRHRAVFDAALMPMVKEPDVDRTFIESVTREPVAS